MLPQDSLYIKITKVGTVVLSLQIAAFIFPFVFRIDSCTFHPIIGLFIALWPCTLILMITNSLQQQQILAKQVTNKNMMLSIALAVSSVLYCLILLYSIGLSSTCVRSPADQGHFLLAQQFTFTLITFFVLFSIMLLLRLLVRSLVMYKKWLIIVLCLFLLSFLLQ